MIPFILDGAYSFENGYGEIFICGKSDEIFIDREGNVFVSDNRYNNGMKNMKCKIQDIINSN